MIAQIKQMAKGIERIYDKMAGRREWGGKFEPVVPVVGRYCWSTSVDAGPKTGSIGRPNNPSDNKDCYRNDTLRLRNHRRTDIGRPKTGKRR